MQTENNIKQVLRTERKKIFWVLYTLPWLVLTAVLIGAIFYILGMKNSEGVKSQTYSCTESNKNIELVKRGFEKETNSISSGLECKGEIKKIYVEAVKNNVGEWICDNDGNVTFKWKPCTESQIVNMVNIKIKELEEINRTNLIDNIEKERKRLYTECEKVLQIEVINKGLGKWQIDEKGINKFVWKTIEEITKEKLSTELIDSENSYMVNRGDSRIDNKKLYTESKRLGIDIEKEIIKSAILGIEAGFFGNNSNKDKEIKERVKIEVSTGIHTIFDGFDEINKIEAKEKETIKKYRIF